VVKAQGGTAPRTGQFDTQLFLPTQGLGTTFTIDRPQVPRHLTFSAGLGVNGASGVFLRGSGPGCDVGTDGCDEAVVPWRLDAEVLATLGLFEWVEIGLAFPVVLASSTDDDPVTSPTLSQEVRFAPGDLRLIGKVPLVRGDFGLAARLVVTLPTGDGEHFLGTDYWTTAPGLVMAYRKGVVGIGADVTYRFRREATLGNFEYDDELQISVGGAVEVARDLLSVIAEAQVRLGVVGAFESHENPAEADLGVRLHLGSGLFLDLGAGTGLLPGYGAPLIRGFAIFRFASERDDPCEYGPEDFDGYEDGDYCADPDNDGDGIEDAEDVCRNDVEDFDEFLDDDGCPDTDNDADGVLDPEDRCPLESEDRDGFQDGDGCPEPDNDEDGVPDGLDSCPMEPEDRDDFQDEDGCPEPGPEAATVTVTDTRILISERIYFDFDTDTIRNVSLPLLDQVASVIQDLPSNRRIRVDGYTDSEGDDQYNLDLSYRRARSVVEYLVGRGVPRERLEYAGYGEVNPVAPNDSLEGRALNRRVEFTILEPGERHRRR